jgi:protoheme IX farnesyltransferase
MKTYYMLTKPGIIFGNVITTASGFALASQGNFNLMLFIITVMGLGFVVASAGVFNNYIDRVADSKMVRTQNRPFVKGSISTQKALIFGALLGFIGGFTLIFFTNFLTFLVTTVGFFIYLVLYAFLKYRSFYGTIVGSLAGAIPPVVGYTAVSNHLDLGALVLFLILILWQMPHFFSIAIYHFEDYAAASIPVLPVQKGMYITKLHMVFYILAFIMSSLLLNFSGHMGYVYAGIALFLGFSWLGLCIMGFTIESSQNKLWAKQMFRFSLVVIMCLCLTISLS